MTKDTERSGFFQDISGDQSSSRLIGFIVLMFSLIESAVILWVGQENIISAATAAGILFTTQCAPVMVFLFANKQSEIKHEEVKKEAEVISDAVNKPQPPQ